MIIRFANPALLAALPLVALPVIAHLLVRARPPVFRFGSLRFIRHVARENRRIRKPWEWILMVLRVLLIATLVLLFCRPRLFHSSVPSVAGRRTVVIVVDASGSMQAVDGARTRFSTACAEAAARIAELHGDDRANVVWIRRQPHSEFPGPGTNTDYLLNRLRAAEGSLESGNIQAAWATAVEQLSQATGDREICLISDFQASAWEGVALVPPAGVRLSAIPVTEQRVDNLAVTSLSCRTGRGIVGVPTMFDCEVSSFAAVPLAASLTFSAGETRETRTVELAPGEKRVLAFTLTLDKPGSIDILAALSEDRFPADDRRWLVCDIVPQLTCALALPEGANRQAWERVIHALPWLGRSDQAGLLIANDEAKLPVGGRALLLDLTGRETDTETGSWSLRRPEDGIYAEVFSGSGNGDPSQVSIQRRSTRVPHGNVLLRYMDDVPAVVHSENTLYWNIPLDAAGSDLPAHAEILLPLVGEALLEMDRQNTPPHPAASPGERLLLASAVPDVGDAPRLTDEQGKEMGTADEVAGVLVARPGLYRWRQGHTILDQVAVGFPVVESDLRALDMRHGLPAADLTARSAAALVAATDGIPIWPQLLGLGTALLAFEAVLLLLLRRLDDQATPTPATEGER